MTILSLMAFLSIADLGIGSSLVTSLSRAVGAEDFHRVRQLQVNGITSVCLIACAMLPIGMALYFLDIGAQVFPLSSLNIQKEATSALSIFVIIFALSLPLTLIGKIQLGLQIGHIANHWAAAAALLNLTGGWFAVVNHAPIPLIIIGMMTGTIVCGLLNAFIFFHTSESKNRIAVADLNQTVLLSLLKDSFFYLILQVIFTITYALDTMLVARMLGAEQAAVFSLSERMFSVVAVLVGIISAPLWAAYGEALGAAEDKWAKNTLRISTVRIVFASTAICICILVSLQPLVGLISSKQLTVPLSLAFAMAAWRVIEAIGSSFSVYLFAKQKIKMVLAMGLATAISSLFGKILLMPLYGFTSIPVVTSLCFVVFCLVPIILFLRQRSL
jgi:O-antigen/teichoic acid export membrane protein